MKVEADGVFQCYAPAFLVANALNDGKVQPGQLPSPSQTWAPVRPAHHPRENAHQFAQSTSSRAAG